MQRQFHNGDIVRLVPEFSTYMKHFDNAGGLAVVLYNYRQRYGGSEIDNHKYGLLLLNEDGTPRFSCSWYNDSDIDYLVLQRDFETLDFLESEYASWL